MPVNNRRMVDHDGSDFYPTPAWATKAIVGQEKFKGRVWEPACGDGAMARELERLGLSVHASDLHYRGYGLHGVDFLRTETEVPNIITNPPFNLAEEFVHQGLMLCQHKLALLLRLSFLESSCRYRDLYSVTPPTRVWVFSERITFYPNGRQTKGSGTLAYAWFVWDKQSPHFGLKSELRWIPPGYKE